MENSDTAEVESPRTWRGDLLLLALLFGALFFFRLGSYPLSNPDEGRYAEIPREMLATGDWVTPRLNGVNYFEKPPLVYWVTAGFLRVFGQNEWSVRAVPAMFAVLGVLLTYAAGRALYDRLTGLLAAFVLGTSLMWFVLGHIPLLDMAMAVFMSGTLFCFICGIREPAGARRRALFMGLYACAALATLTKGLMGFMVSGAVMFLWLVLLNGWSRLRPLYLPTGIILFLAIALPWHLLAAQRNETWVHRYIVFEHFLRFLTPAASRPGPWHLFLWVVLAGLIPWTGFLWPALRDAVRAGWKKRSEHAETWFLVTWVGFIVFFFSTSKSKLPPYISPVFPALALLVASELARRWRDASATSLRLGFRLVALFCAVLAAALTVVVSRPDLVRMKPDQAVALRPAAAFLAAMLLAGAIVIPWVARRKGVRVAVAAIGAMMVGFYATLVLVAPILNKPGTKALALWAKANARPEDRIFHCYDFYQDFTFYAERHVGIVGRNFAELELEEDEAARTSGRFISDAELEAQWTQPGRIFLVIQKRKIEHAKRDYAVAMDAWRKAPASAAPEKPIFADPPIAHHVVAETPTFLLVSNRAQPAQ